MKFRPNTDEHDYVFKKNHIIRFLTQGDKVKAAVFFRGREIVHQSIGRAIIDLGHSLGLQIVAEGVETLGQLEFLERHLCDQVQGYLIATPAPATEALEHANAWGRPTPAPAKRLG